MTRRWFLACLAGAFAAALSPLRAAAHGPAAAVRVRLSEAQRERLRAAIRRSYVGGPAGPPVVLTGLLSGRARVLTRPREMNFLRPRQR